MKPVVEVAAQVGVYESSIINSQPAPGDLWRAPRTHVADERKESKLDGWIYLPILRSVEVEKKSSLGRVCCLISVTQHESEGDPVIFIGFTKPFKSWSLVD